MTTLPFPCFFVPGKLYKHTPKSNEEIVYFVSKKDALDWLNNCVNIENTKTGVFTLREHFMVIESMLVTTSDQTEVAIFRFMSADHTGWTFIINEFVEDYYQEFIPTPEQEALKVPELIGKVYKLTQSVSCRGVIAQIPDPIFPTRYPVTLLNDKNDLEYWNSSEASEMDLKSRSRIMGYSRCMVYEKAIVFVVDAVRYEDRIYVKYMSGDKLGWTWVNGYGFHQIFEELIDGSNND
jgi:hypothetical protein